MNNPVALVTGASRGIGQSIAINFAKHGYDLIIICKSSQEELTLVAKEIRTYGVRCLSSLADVSSYDAIAQLFSSIADFSQQLDVVVNNAAISYIGLLTDMHPSQWQSIIQTNLSGLFNISKFAVPLMVSQKSGAIINISSMWGIEGASCEVAYSASKGGVNAFTKALAKELAPSNILVNAISCGVIDTDMNHWLDDHERATLIEDIPLGRIGTPDDIANLCLFLASKKAGYITGQIISVDGGF